ncbi:hypothetical protein DIPPA_33484 [Diplonema papillatum]|nr:hypothetical protein DIPPA_33484 [Diplonema papillatum]
MQQYGDEYEYEEQKTFAETIPMTGSPKARRSGRLLLSSDRTITAATTTPSAPRSVEKGIQQMRLLNKVPQGPPPNVLQPEDPRGAVIRQLSTLLRKLAPLERRGSGAGSGSRKNLRSAQEVTLDTSLLLHRTVAVLRGNRSLIEAVTRIPD